jgi:EAL domain-containing protein (putative c-di-GMP-specific phosphodiesterase class I)
MARVTIYATYDQLDTLDRARMGIRRTFQASLDRTALIRALLEAYRRSGIDLVAEGVRDEAEVADLIERRLRREPHEEG